MRNSARKPLICKIGKKGASNAFIGMLIIFLFIMVFIMTFSIAIINDEKIKTSEKKINLITENPLQISTEKITINSKEETTLNPKEEEINNLIRAENQKQGINSNSKGEKSYNINLFSAKATKQDSSAADYETIKEKTNLALDFFGGKTNRGSGLCPAEMKGFGNSENPCQITNWAQLQAVNEKLNLYYVLENDLDGATKTDNSAGTYNPLFIFSLLDKIKIGKGIGFVSADTIYKKNFIPIGTFFSPFTGTFDGKGYTIKNLYINNPYNDYVGLFGVNKGTIRNIKLTNVEITGRNYVGGLAGTNSGIIENSSSIGNINGFSELENSDNQGNYIGGLVGSNEDHGEIKNSYAKGNVIGVKYVGGFVGQSTTHPILGPSAFITGSYFEGKVKGYSSVGGFAGINNQGGAKPSALITESYAKGIAEGKQFVGGFVGKNNFGQITNSYFIGEVKGTNNYNSVESVNEPIGGFAGFNAETNSPQNLQGQFIKNSYAIAEVMQRAPQKIEKTKCFVGTTNYNTGNSISDSFWNNQKCLLNGGGGTGKTTTQMFTQSIFTDAGWDFANTWKITNSADSDFVFNSYPCLQWQDDSTCKFATLNELSLQIAFTSPTPLDNSILSQNFIRANAIANGDESVTITIYLHNSSGLINSASGQKNKLLIDFTNLADGIYYLNATASDGFGNKKQTETRKITLINFNCQSGMAGDGTLANPCQITNWTQLQAVNEWLEANYILMNNLDSSTSGFADYQTGKGFTPIGNNSIQFNGSFNGKGYTIKNLYINNSDNDYIGLFGINKGTIADISLINSNIKGNNTVGGLVGLNYGEIENSNSIGNVNGKEFVGGLAGENSKNGIIFDSYSDGNVSGSGDAVAGLVGFNNEGNISNSYADAKVDGNNTVGGLVGNNNGNIFNSYATGNVNGNDYHIGGLVGWNYLGNIYNSYATGNVIGIRETGGLVGVNEKNIYNSYSSGNVSGTSTLGGLVGINIGGIYNSYSSGNADGDYYIGGLVGLNDAGNISNSYANGNVNGNDFSAGGLVGDNRGNILNSYSFGNVTGSSFAGGLVGINFATCTSLFWDTQTSGQSASACGTGKTTSEMKTKTTFTSAGWDFINIWDIDDIAQIINNGYPYLR